MVGLGLDTIDVLVASIAKAIRDRMTRGHGAECEKARLGHGYAAVGHAPGTPWREAAGLRQVAEVGQVVQRLRPHGQDVTRNPGFFAIVRGQSALALMQINSANWPRRC